jgi:2-polyprenyl-6-methoxyphenol hydroxylase-like FAD-dependent oxidoreductase
VVGGGPAGLYFSCLLKHAFPSVNIRLFEQNYAGTTYGFGVVFSQRALDFLREDDAETHALITAAMESWQDLNVVHRGERVCIDGIGFSALDRLELLQLLQRRLHVTGVEPRYGTALDSLGQISDAELIVGADGVNSLVRRAGESMFGTRIEHGSNRFAWFGTTQRFDTLTQTFRATEYGAVTAHHYRYRPDKSTFIVEMPETVWQRTGLAEDDEQAGRALCEKLFAAELEGHPLICNRSFWRRFPRVHNASWSAGNTVLLGDALHTAHFSIGSGTRLALEDAIALVHALKAHTEIADALAAFEATRRPIVEKLVAAADASLTWYEQMEEHMRLAPYDFAYSYINRSGRVSDRTLASTSPAFMEGYQASRVQVSK